MENSDIKNNISVTIGLDNYQTSITNGRNTILADEPEDLGGKDTGFTPTELLLSSLGACTAITLRMYAGRKGWDVQKISVRLDLDQEKNETGLLTNIKREISFEGNLTEEHRKRLLQIANSCPIHKILTNPIAIHTELV